MAGERTHVAGFRQISAVCTHPDYQGRGFAHRQMARDERPFLHVMRSNDAAWQGELDAMRADE